ncbi:hypothetical protein LTR07_001283 [Exophiala xenobiotica]|nr:hypothetical protein LTR79_008775 [Exophiala xenobiotica]KAK5415009.1 hypothetical protein LTR90_006056 [Exophiala xenobiotica]KAK5514384.1 hypothetical protein LTR21_004628 [Exophiala xenobiotica]KAK5525592.1 hypothetical protein LTR07_001283 [Exophiala xenobiotica]
MDDATFTALFLAQFTRGESQWKMKPHADPKRWKGTSAIGSVLIDITDLDDCNDCKDAKPKMQEYARLIMNRKPKLFQRAKQMTQMG